MEYISYRVENDSLYLQPLGRVDSSNAAVLEKEIFDVLKAHPGLTPVLDCDALEYISSAGLRVVLRLRKESAELRVINVSSDVYEIFEMTGFTEMIPVEKGYRKLSVDGCEVIGRGANGVVYRLDPDTIIKVYLSPDSLADIHKERELARRAFVLGVPTAIPYDVVKVGDSYGSVFELLNAKSFAKILAEEPERLDEIAAMNVELLKTIHGTEVRPEDMPDMRAVALDWVAFLKDYLPAESWEKLHELVVAVPVNHHMMHGDYHVKNVMVQNGEALLIDMDTLTQGDPVFEFASIYNAYVGFLELDHSVAQDFLGISYEMATELWKKTLRLYFDTTDERLLQAVEDKAALIGYVRLLRRTIRRHGLETEEGRKLIAFYKERIETLLGRVDTLSL